MQNLVAITLLGFVGEINEIAIEIKNNKYKINYKGKSLVKWASELIRLLGTYDISKRIHCQFNQN